MQDDGTKAGSCASQCAMVHLTQLQAWARQIQAFSIRAGLVACGQQRNYQYEQTCLN